MCDSAIDRTTYGVQRWCTPLAFRIALTVLPILVHCNSCVPTALSPVALGKTTQPSDGAVTLGSSSESAPLIIDRDYSVTSEASTISNVFTLDFLESILSGQTASTIYSTEFAENSDYTVKNEVFVYSHLKVFKGTLV